MFKSLLPFHAIRNSGRLILPSSASTLLQRKNTLSSLINNNNSDAKIEEYPLDVPLPNIPPLIKLTNQEELQTKITTLPNGMRVCSENSLGQIAAAGLLVDTGMRWETPATLGTSYFLQRMSFKATKNRTAEELTEELSRMGSNFMSFAYRESITYSCMLLRHHVPDAVKLIADVALNPLFSEEELEMQKLITRHQILPELRENPNSMLGDMIHHVAYANTPMANSEICPEERLDAITLKGLEEFRKTFFVPERFIFAASGVDHDELVDVVKENFGHLPRNGKVIEKVPAVYSGGAKYLDEQHHPFLSVAIAFPGHVFGHPDNYAEAILDSLLGGGDSFSSGGPGKGMYSRLYTNLLNNYHWLESCQVLSLVYSDCALSGVTASCPPEYANVLMKTICKELKSIPKTLVPSEVARAKNQLCSSLLMNLETKSIQLDDIAKQVHVLNKRIPANELIDTINRVTVDDIKRVAASIFSQPPTVVAVGDTSRMPSLKEIQQML